MNIFVLDENPQKAARYHCDKHVVKMIIETAQMLSCAHHMLNPESQILDHIYRRTHRNHPCAVWVRDAKANYLWTLELLKELLKEYSFRYHDRVHKTSEILKYLESPPIGIKDNLGEKTSFAMAMPDDYKSENVVSSYRNYYMGEKRELLSYSRRSVPDWL